MTFKNMRFDPVTASFTKLQTSRKLNSKVFLTVL